MPSRVGGPLIRTPVTREVLRQLDGLPAADAHNILARFGPARAAEISSRVGVSWSDLESFLDLIDCLAEHIGADRVRDLFERGYLEGFSKIGFVESFIEAALRLWSRSPVTLARALPAAWNSLSRDCGVFSTPTRTGEQSFQIELSNCHPMMRERTAWTTAFEGVFLGFFAQLGVTGEATMVDFDVRTGVARYEAGWVTTAKAASSR